MLQTGIKPKCPFCIREIASIAEMCKKKIHRWIDIYKEKVIHRHLERKRNSHLSYVKYSCIMSTEIHTHACLCLQGIHTFIEKYCVCVCACKHFCWMSVKTLPK